MNQRVSEENCSGGQRRPSGRQGYKIEMFTEQELMASFMTCPSYRLDRFVRGRHVGKPVLPNSQESSGKETDQFYFFVSLHLCLSETLLLLLSLHFVLFPFRLLSVMSETLGGRTAYA